MRIVGRRVKIVKAEDSLEALGKIGIVVKQYKNDTGKLVPLFLVRIKGWDQGHGNDSNEWYFYRKALRLLPRRGR